MELSQESFAKFEPDVNLIITYKHKDRIYKLGLIKSKLKTREEIENWFNLEMSSRKLIMSDFIIKR
jgi:hypothetical protein